MQLGALNCRGWQLAASYQDASSFSFGERLLPTQHAGTRPPRVLAQRQVRCEARQAWSLLLFLQVLLVTGHHATVGRPVCSLLYILTCCQSQVA